MSVEPCYGFRDAAEDDAVCDILPNLVLIEASVSSLMQAREAAIEAVGDGLTLTLINICSQTDTQYGDDSRRDSYLRIEMNSVVLSAGRHE